MDAIFQEAIAYAVTLAPLIAALLQVVKLYTKSNDFIPLYAIAIGVCAGLAFGAYLDADLFIYGLAGLLSGLSSSGFYDTISTVVDKVKQYANK